MLDDWNAALYAEFFDGRWNGRPLYLDMEDEVLGAIGRRVGTNGDPAGSLLDAVRDTLDLGVGEAAFGRHAEELQRWRDAGRVGVPPFLALLACLALIAERMRSDAEFRANNYRDRLAQALDLDERQSRKIKQALPRADMYWDELNSWLIGHDGQLGLPTAFAFDHRRHVGLPISQALIRATDREQLTRCFASHGLHPGPISRGEMREILLEWIPASGSATLRSHWLNNEARERIVAAACLEVESWDGGVTEDVGHVPSPLLLVAAQRGAPPRRLDLSFRVRAAAHVSLGAYHDARMTGACHAAFPVVGKDPELVESWDPGWLELSAPKVSVPDLLLCDVRLDARSGSHALIRRPRSLTVLEFDHESRMWVERRRARLGRRNLLLVHGDLAAHVAELLVEIAASGWVREGAGELPGCPDGWELFSNVTVSAVVEDEKYTDDTDMLRPDHLDGIELTGGFRLPGHSTWHRSHPPTVVAASDRPVRLLLVPIWRADDAANASEIAIEHFVGTGAMDLDGLVPADGDYRIVMLGSGSVAEVDSVPVRFRSGDRPKREQADPRLTHYPAHGSVPGALSAAPLDEAWTPAVRGAVVLGLGDSEPTPSGTPPDSIPTGRDSEPDEGWLPEPADGVASGRGVDCLGGAHHWILDTVPPDTARAVRGQCQHCGLVRKHGRGQKARAARARPVVPASTTRYVLRELPESRRPDCDSLLDALSYLRSGSWRSFVSLAEQVDDHPWFAIEVARSLSALGHVDLRVAPETGRPVAWSIAPRAISLLPHERGAILCGARSSALMDAINVAVEMLDGKLLVERNEQGPSALRIVDLDRVGLQLVAEDAAERCQLAVTVVESAPEQILQSLPSVPSIASSLTPIPRPDAEVRRYDVRGRTWTLVDGVARPGAYQFRTRPTQFGYRHRAGDDLLAGDSRLVKLLAHVDARVSPFAYERKQQRLIVPLGARLPGLYERALTLCSGRLPRRVGAGLVAYEEVPITVAAHLWRALWRDGR